DGIGVPADDGARTAAFAAQLTAYSDRNGKTSATFDRAAYPFGPYLRMGIPVNPLPDADAPGVQAGIAWVVGGTDPLTADGAASEAGWKFNAETGRLIANSDDLSSDGIRAYDAW
ncbi:MAG: hypothetical protein KC466_08865, partial [Myxococcales bacterium]|nr:hypothetical protein [Myxococcales bacterium]